MAQLWQGLPVQRIEDDRDNELSINWHGTDVVARAEVLSDHKSGSGS